MNKEFSSTNIFTSCNETHFISEYFYSGENILIFLRPVSIRAGKEISVPIGEKVSGRNSPSFRSIESSRVPYRFIGFTRYPSSRFFFFFLRDEGRPRLAYYHLSFHLALGISVLSGAALRATSPRVILRGTRISCRLSRSNGPSRNLLYVGYHGDG